MTGFSVTPLAGLPEVRTGDDLGAMLAKAAPKDLADQDVLVVAHKVVSKAEGRVRKLEGISPGRRALDLAVDQDKDPRVVQAILDESAEVLRSRPGVMICVTHHGFVCANAGVDRSNTAARDELLLLPEDPDLSARGLREAFGDLLGVRPAVVVSDSFGRAWRLGQTDVAIGVAGLRPIDDWRGRTDGADRDLAATELAVADSAAAAADLARSKDSRQPAVLMRGLERFVIAEHGPGAAALRRPREEDLFR